MNDYNEAVKRIELTAETNATELDLSGLDINSLPPEISVLTRLEVLYLGNTGVSDLGPVAGLTRLKLLYLGNTGVSQHSVEEMRSKSVLVCA